MNNKVRQKNKELVTLTVALIIFLVVMGISYGLISNAKINDNTSSQRSDVGLTCKVTINKNATTTFTWYKNNVQNTTVNIDCIENTECTTTAGLGNIPNTFTNRTDVWICSVSFNNDTGIETQNTTTVTIIDTPPDQPKIYYNTNGTEIFNETVNIQEDASINFNVTSSDWDHDTITYIMEGNPGFCSINSVNGLLNCTPTNETDINPYTFSIGAKTPPITTNSRSFSINVTPNNDAPIFSPALSTQDFIEGQRLNYTIIGSDEENNILNLRVLTIIPSIVDSTPTPSLEIVRLSANTFTLRLQDDANITFKQAQKNYTVTVLLNDTDNITYNSKNITTSFMLQGISFNHLPNISYIVINNNSLRQGNALNIYINATDIDNNSLTFSADNIYSITGSSEMNYTCIENSSFAYAYINITNLTNNHVINHTFTITVNDTNTNAYQTINIFVNNTNDVPFINEMSNDGENKFNTTNISNLLAYTGILFKYRVNASDPDYLTYDWENTGILTYNTSDPTFYINSTTGYLEFTPLIAGNYTFNVTVKDGMNATYNRTAQIQILLNRNPIFTTNPIIINCNESDQYNWNRTCYYNINESVTDEDVELNDKVNLFWTNSSLFVINNITGIINFSANQSMVGNHSIMLNITDRYGGMNSTTIYLIVNNTNNAPIMQPANIPSGNFMVGTAYNITYTATDSDLSFINIDSNLSDENLTFNSTIIGLTGGTNISAFSLQKISDTQAVLMIIPISANYEGNYSINITVTDTSGNRSSNQTFKYIYNITNPPTISQIIPSGTPFNDTIDNTTWKNVIDFSDRTTTINISENTTIIFNQTSFADNSSYPNSLNYVWYFDNNLVSTNTFYQAYFNFTSNGTHNITVIAIDSYLSNNSFKWIVNVTNVNRPPTYNANSIENLTISGSFSIANYLTYSDGRRRFYDPDDDLQNLTYTTDNTTNLLFTSTTCSHANFSFNQKALKIDAESLGQCMVIFTATDMLDLSSVSSEAIFINITNLSKAVSEPIQVVVPSNGGGVTNTPIPIPLPIEIEKPKPLQILTPKLVTVYKNATIKIPIIINNTWNGTLIGIMLEAYTNASNVSLNLDKIYLPKLESGEGVEATLTVQNYKSEGHYEIQIKANVSVPEYHDMATIFINSAEMRSEGEELESKISFAKDLLSSNPECQELNELLLKARKELDNNNYATTTKIITDVLNGCKYLVNNAKDNKEMPDRNFVKTFEWQKKYNDYLLLGLFGILFIISLIYILKSDNPEQNF